jgi:hypothetical protein
MHMPKENTTVRRSQQALNEHDELREAAIDNDFALLREPNGLGAALPPPSESIIDQHEHYAEAGSEHYMQEE